MIVSLWNLLFINNIIIAFEMFIHVYNVFLSLIKSQKKVVSHARRWPKHPGTVAGHLEVGPAFPRLHRLQVLLTGGQVGCHLAESQRHESPRSFFNDTMIQRPNHETCQHGIFKMHRSVRELMILAISVSQTRFLPPIPSWLPRLGARSNTCCSGGRNP